MGPYSRPRSGALQPPPLTGALAAATCLGVCLTAGLHSPASAQFLAEGLGYPYVQNPAPREVTVLWWTSADSPGVLEYGAGQLTESATSKPVKVLFTRPEKEDAVTRYKHEVRVTNLSPGTRYMYRVTQGRETFESTFGSAPREQLTPIRFLVWADTETEPASRGRNGGGAPADYAMDQDQGVMACTLAASRLNPDFILLVGDVTEAGGELEDWDEFFLKVNGRASPLASRIPFLAALGNHDYWGGGPGGGYNQPQSEMNAIHKYRHHFALPSNTRPTSKVDPAWPSEKSPVVRAEQNERYYSFTYGPATFIALDTCNQSPNESSRDTCFYLLGENEPDGGFAPDWMPGSRQFQWLEDRLKRAQEESLFTFVYWHHAPFASGPHGVPPKADPQSGTPTRRLDKILHRYRVTAVFNGHDEAVEMSETTGDPRKGGDPDHVIRYFIPGTAGDGIRDVMVRLNPKQVFHYADSRIGRHYGFLDVRISPVPGNEKQWKATFRQAWIDPRWAGNRQVNPIGGYYDEAHREAYFEAVAEAP